LITTGQRFWGGGDSIAGEDVVEAWSDKFIEGLGDFVPTGSPARNSPDTDYASGVSIGLVEASAQYLTGPGVAADYVTLSNGGGSTIGVAFVDGDPTDNTQILLATSNIVLSGVGMFVRRRASTEGILWQITDGSGGVFVQMSIDGCAPNDQLNTVSIDLIDATPGDVGGTDWRITVNGELVGSGEIGASQSYPSGSPAGVLRVGTRSVTVTELFEGTIGELVWCAAVVPEIGAYLETLRS
jgi:hypothetical protein